MQQTDKKLKELKMILDEAESKIAAAKRILFEQVYQEQAKVLNLNDSLEKANIVEGVFDGEEMIDSEGKKYPVPANYASKSKLVPGDKLKLIIADDGTFIFKQIGPVDRKRLVGILTQSGEDWTVTADSKKYRVLQATVTYFKACAGDEVTILVPRTGETNWAAIENCLNHKKEKLK
ncbi:MAG: hypothetical protein WCV58_02610 [Patescibacteria group bacterium]